MPNAHLVTASVVCVAGSAVLILYPQALSYTSRLLNRQIATLDEFLLRTRYVWAVLLAVAGYGLFKLSLMLPR